MTFTDDYLKRVNEFECYACAAYKSAGKFHAAGIRKAIESAYGVMKQSHAITLEKDITRWMRHHPKIALLGVEGRTHHYSFK
jgi:hypothetical protein